MFLETWSCFFTSRDSLVRVEREGRRESDAYEGEKQIETQTA